MSPEEVRESQASGEGAATAVATDPAATEKPKVVRRRRTTKTEDNADQPVLLADTTIAPATTAKKAAPKTPRKTTKTKAASEGETAPATGAENNAVAVATSAPVISTPTASAPVVSASTFPNPVAAETAVPTPRVIVNPPIPERYVNQGNSQENNTRSGYQRDNGPRNRNFGGYNENQENESQNSDNNAPSGENGSQNPRNFGNQPENGQQNQNGGDGQNFRNFGNQQDGGPQSGENGGQNSRNFGGQQDNNGGDRPAFEGDDRGFDNRGRFRGNRNQMRRDRPLNNRNGRFGGPNNENGGSYNAPPRRREFDLLMLEAMEMPELLGVAGEFSLETPPEEKNDLVWAILEAQAASQNALLKRGTLEILPDGKGFLRCEGYLPSESDVYVSQSQIKRFNLKTGDYVTGTSRVPKEMERFHGLLRVEAINGFSPEVMKTRKEFEKLTPIFPTEKFILETDQANITARIIDLVSPLGKGQRGLIVAPPKAGKTTLIKNIANSIAQNHPEVILIVLLIDERPEEVTDISRSIRGEVVASTFDEMPENHMRVADIVMEKAKRLVELKNDVVILLDSITRLSRASNLVVTPSGRTLSGGLDPAAMYRPKRMFGAARNIEEGGSLTILATALVDTGSRMDEMIFEEFKGTGNLDLVLDRNLFDQRIFPAIDINRSGTRRDDLLLNKEDLATVYHLRRTLAQLDNDKAVTLLIDRLKNTRTNAEFMGVVAKSARNAGSTAG